MIFGKNLAVEIQTVLAEENTFAITDETVFSLYKDLFFRENTCVIKPGESQKHFGTVLEICEFLLKKGADRHSKLVAVGGGVIGDICGFAAAIYMRGIDWINIPTTLLAQCDSSVGGKTGVDLGPVKNILGAFHFPEAVYISNHFLRTLNEREWLCGMGEVLKTACLNKELYRFYQANAAKILKRDEAALLDIVEQCARYKDYVVTEDPYETSGLRKTLNVGHTAGHAFEAADNHQRSHGEYVLWGMLAENRMCADHIAPEYLTESESLIIRILGTSRFPRFNLEKAAAAAASDKKNQNGGISIMVCLMPGQIKEVYFSKEQFAAGLEKAVYGG